MSLNNSYTSQHRTPTHAMSNAGNKAGGKGDGSASRGGTPQGDGALSGDVVRNAAMPHGMREHGGDGSYRSLSMNNVPILSGDPVAFLGWKQQILMVLEIEMHTMMH